MTAPRTYQEGYLLNTSAGSVGQALGRRVLNLLAELQSHRQLSPDLRMLHDSIENLIVRTNHHVPRRIATELSTPIGMLPDSPLKRQALALRDDALLAQEAMHGLTELNRFLGKRVRELKEARGDEQAAAVARCNHLLHRLIAMCPHLVTSLEVALLPRQLPSNDWFANHHELHRGAHQLLHEQLRKNASFFVPLPSDYRRTAVDYMRDVTSKPDSTLGFFMGRNGIFLALALGGYGLVPRQAYVPLTAVQTLRLQSQEQPTQAHTLDPKLAHPDAFTHYMNYRQFRPIRRDGKGGINDELEPSQKATLQRTTFASQETTLTLEPQYWPDATMPYYNGFLYSQLPHFQGLWELRRLLLDSTDYQSWELEAMWRIVAHATLSHARTEVVRWSPQKTVQLLAEIPVETR